MLFKSWDNAFDIIITGVLFYFSLIAMLRVSGKRTLADLNAFDLVVTVSIGSMTATTILSNSTTYFDGFLGVGILIILQYIVAKSSAKSKLIKKLVKSKPALVYYEGEYLKDEMKRQRITEEDILEQIRLTAGTTSDKVKAVILETNGKMSVITHIGDSNEKEISRL